MNIRAKASDYIAMFLCKQGIGHVFIVSGGASIHLLHSLAKVEGISPVPVHHEQAAGMAADGYSRASGRLGAAVATSGPGATNLLTAIAGAWFDSIPIIFITGQVATFRMKRDSLVRQLGFQETDIVSMAKPVTKHAVQVNSISELETALHNSVKIALSGRPGPVLIDIPDDIQRSIGNFAEPRYIVDEIIETDMTDDHTPWRKIMTMIREASRPVIIFGAGANGQDTREICRKIARDMRVPVLLTWRAKDLVSEDCAFLVGTFGSHGTRWGNFAVQNSDLVLVLGSRLSTRETGGDIRLWARHAKIIHVDIDKAELDKFSTSGRKIDLSIRADLIKFLPIFYRHIISDLKDLRVDDWVAWINERKVEFSYRLSRQEISLSGYDFYLTLKNFISSNEHLFLDTGCTVAWAMQSLQLIENQRIHHDCNNTAMGWALPAAIGGLNALPHANITCISGDGSLMMNIQELATLKKYAASLKIIVLNNFGYAMVRQTEDQWLSGEHVGTDSRNDGLSFPNFVKLAQSFGIEATRVTTLDGLKDALNRMYRLNNLNFLEIMIDPESCVIPQVKFGKPLEDSEPYLDRTEIVKHMLIPLIDE